MPLLRQKAPMTSSRLLSTQLLLQARKLHQDSSPDHCSIVGTWAKIWSESGQAPEIFSVPWWAHQDTQMVRRQRQSRSLRGTLVGSGAFGRTRHLMLHCSHVGIGCATCVAVFVRGEQSRHPSSNRSYWTFIYLCLLKFLILFLNKTTGSNLIF